MTGRLTVLGLGPGDPALRSAEASARLRAARHICGYQTYLDLGGPYTSAHCLHPSGNGDELMRARQALALAAGGEDTVLVTSGDPGIFAMASAVMEVLDQTGDEFAAVPVEIMPGISAMQAAAARCGAILGHDFCVISLSDIRKPWSIIVHRLEMALIGDFVIALYNPASSRRRHQIEQALAIIRQHRAVDTPVVRARNVSRTGELVEISPLSAVQPDEIDMRTILLIGSSQTRLITRPGQPPLVYTPRSLPTVPAAADSNTG